MPNKSATDSPWIDIIPPLAPAYTDTTLLITALFLLIPAAGLWYWYHQRPRQRARRELRRLGRALYSTQADYRSISLALYACLCRAWSLPHLHQLRFADGDNREWRRFLERLSRFCFSPVAPGKEALEAGIAEAGSWLKQKRVPD